MFVPFPLCDCGGAGVTGRWLVLAASLALPASLRGVVGLGCEAGAGRTGRLAALPLVAEAAGTGEQSGQFWAAWHPCQRLSSFSVLVRPWTAAGMARGWRGHGELTVGAARSASLLTLSPAFTNSMTL